MGRALDDAPELGAPAEDDEVAEEDAAPELGAEPELGLGSELDPDVGPPLCDADWDTGGEAEAVSPPKLALPDT